jgi:1,4-dihydroxy-2-naphthoate octaprenyltransferase
LRIWWLASRPATLTAAIAPLAVGGALAHAHGGWQPAAWTAALLGAMFIQLGTNYANDVFDYEKGADTAARQGPLRVTQAGLVSPQAVKRAMLLAFAAAVLCGTYLVWLCGWPLVALGVASVISGVLYTGGPWPLGYLGLGDVFVFAFFGVAAVAGTVFVQLRAVPADVWLWSLPVGATCTAILVVNNLRDARTDVLVGKRTLAVRFGAAFVRWEYGLLWLMALAVPLALALRDRSPWLALPCVLTPAAVSLTREVATTDDGPRLNAALAKTARMHLVAGLLMAAAILAQAMTARP